MEGQHRIIRLLLCFHFIIYKYKLVLFLNIPNHPYLKLLGFFPIKFWMYNQLYVQNIYLLLSYLSVVWYRYLSSSFHLCSLHLHPLPNRLLGSNKYFGRTCLKYAVYNRSSGWCRVRSDIPGDDWDSSADRQGAGDRVKMEIILLSRAASGIIQSGLT